MANINLGKVALTAAGDYDSNATYEKLDIVNYQGSSYVAKKNVPIGTNINNEEYWQLLAKRSGSLSIGTVETVSSSTDASATITGTADNPILNLSIPRGVTGNESINDNAGNGDTDYVWSADKSWNEINNCNVLIEQKASGINLTKTGAIIAIDAAEDTEIHTTISSSGNIFKSSKNLLNPIAYEKSFSSYGLGTVTENSNGTIQIVGGTPTANLYFYYNRNTTAYGDDLLYLPAGKYTLSIINILTNEKPSGLYSFGVSYYNISDTSTRLAKSSRLDRITDTNYIVMTFDEDSYIQPYFSMNSSNIVPNQTIAIQLEYGEEKTNFVEPSFYKYTNTLSANIESNSNTIMIWSNKNSITAEYIADTKKYIESYSSNQEDINLLETRMDNLEEATTQNTTDIASLQSNILFKQQAVADAGKCLYIGDDGKVIPAQVGTPTAQQISEVVTSWMNEHPGITMQYDSLTGEIGVINTQYPWGDVRRYGIFPDGQTNWNSLGYVQNAIDNSTNLGLEIYWPAGYYRHQLLIMQSNVRMYFEDGSEFGGLIHVISHSADEDPNSPSIENISLRGHLATYNRYGQTDAHNVWIERLHLKSDTSKDSDSSSLGRAAHFYWGNDGFWCNEIVVDNCDNTSSNTNAAISIDGPGNNPKNFHIGKIHIKDSKVTGLYLTGTGHWIGEIQVDAFGADAYTGQGVLDANNTEQQHELCGVWLNRVSDCYIGKISVNQNTIDTRSNAKYSVRIDETGIDQFGSIKIDQINVQNVKGSNRGVTFGDINYPSPRCYADVGLITISADSSTTLTGYGLLTLAAESAVNVHSLFENGVGTKTDVLNNSSISQIDMKITN